jgi:8-oxo-dGTP pyrophosphatase MutT (NUDIX family)
MSNDNKDAHIMWKLSKESVVQHNDWTRQIVKEYTLPNGKPKKAYVNKAHDYVVGMCLTPDMDIVLCREFRPGPEKIMLDMPAGAVNHGEDPVIAMARELQEETGYAGTVEFVNSTIVNPYSIQRRHTFVIRNAVKVSGQDTDHDEFIEVVLMPLPQFINEWVLDGKTTNSAAAIFCLKALGMLQVDYKNGRVLQPMSSEKVVEIGKKIGLWNEDGSLGEKYGGKSK